MITDNKIPNVILKKEFFWYPILNIIIADKIVINVRYNGYDIILYK